MPFPKIKLFLIAVVVVVGSGWTGLRRQRPVQVEWTGTKKGLKKSQTRELRQRRLFSQSSSLAAAAALDFVVEVKSNVCKRKKEKKAPFQTRGLFSIVVVVVGGGVCS